MGITFRTNTPNKQTNSHNHHPHHHSLDSNLQKGRNYFVSPAISTTKNVVHYRTYYSTLKKSELAFYRNYLLPTIYKKRHKLEKMDMTYINSKHFLPEILNF